jgi:hypothetical protein
VVLIGLSGYAQAGKDTIGKILVDSFGFRRVSFADKLREVALAINPIIDYRALTGLGWQEVRLDEIVSEHGWELAKGRDEVRRLLQVIGTDAGRAILGDNIWVEAAFKGLEEGGRYVFTDVRFPNEAHAIRERNGKVFRVDRPGYGPVNNHPSETALDNYKFNAHIFNNRDIHSLEAKVQELLTWYDLSGA